MKKYLNYNFIRFLLALFFIMPACSRVCYLQEVDEFGNEINSNIDSIQNQPLYVNQRKVSGYERFRNFIGDRNSLQSRNINPEQVFKVRFCNYMLGYRDDNPKELVEMAKNISSSYKKMRMYDMASKFDSYQDVLIYGKETIPESWDDTTDLLEEFRRNLAIKKHKEACRQKKIERSKMSFWEKIFGKSKKKKACEYVSGEPTFDPENSEEESITPTIIMAPPGCYSYRGQSDYHDNDNYKNSSCKSCSIGRQRNISAKTYSDPSISTTLDGANDYF